jgi:hypothetical protein
MIGDDPRFFPPEEEGITSDTQGDHNYNANQSLCDAIAAGARGAYWNILRKMDGKSTHHENVEDKKTKRIIRR